MTTLLHESWEGGTNAASCTTSNTAFNALITRWTFDNTHVPTGQGSLSGKLVVSAQTAQAQANLATASDNGYAELWVWAAALPAADTAIGSFRTTGSAANLAQLKLGADGSLSLRDAGFTRIAGTAAGAFVLSAWNKIQWFYGNTSGQQRLRLFTTTPAGNTPDYDSGLVTSTAAGQIGLFQIGVVNATTWTAWFGDVDLNDTGFLTSGGTGSGGTVTWRGSDSQQFLDSAHTATVTIPSTVAAGDVMTLKFIGGQQTNQTDPSGWARLGIAQSIPNLSFNAWQRTATSTDHGTTVTVVSDNTTSFSRHLHLDVYTGGKVGDVGSALATTAATAHNTPNVATVDPQAWIENGCADRGTPSSASWTLPSNLTQRTVQIQTTGGGIVSSVTATDDAVGTGTLGSNTFSGTLATTKAVAWTIAIEPTTAVSPLTVNAGPDVFVEPWRTLTITPTASTTPTSWAWSQLSAVAGSGFTTPGTVTDLTAGATVDANGTIHLTAPAAIVPMQYTLRVVAHKTGVTPDAFDNVVITVYPATRWFVSLTGELKPIRYQQVT